MDGQCFKNYLWMALNEKKVSKLNKNFIKISDEESDKGHILETDVEYSKRLQNFHNDLPILPERMKI